MSKKKEILTLEEAKKDFKKGFITVLIILAVITGVAFVINVAIGLLAAIGSLILFVVLFFSEKVKLKRNFCPDCHTKYNYETDVRWSVVSSERVKHQPTSSRSSNVSLTDEVKSLVSCECICRGCGKTTSFEKNVTTSKYYTDGSAKHTNLREYMRGYFKL